MIIKHQTGEIDTNKLSDITAMILEKSEELRKLCIDNKRQCAILVDASGTRNGKFTCHWNLVESANANISDDYKLVDDVESRNYIAHFYAGIDEFIRTISKDQVIVIPISKLK